MSLSKRILDSSAGLALLSWLFAVYVRLVGATTRWTIVGGEHAERFWKSGSPCIACFWHGRMFPMRFSWPRRVPIDVLISAHRDGRLIAAVIRWLGVGAVVGSSSRGGTRAILDIRKRIAGGVSIGFTPDGPRGPRMRVSPGVIQLAALTRVPILPVSFSTTRAKVFGSWDRFVLALPFARGVFIFGPPIEIPERPDAATVETLRRALEDGLNAITAEADRLCHQPTVAPAEPEENGAEPVTEEPAGAQAGGGR